MSEDPATSAAVDVAARVRRREWSPVEITESLLALIVREPRTQFAVLGEEGAPPQARDAADAVVGWDALDPLHEVAVTLKDIQAVAGLPTSRGSRLSDPAPAAEDAPLVARLRAAGAIIVGTTTLPADGWTARDVTRRGFTRSITAHDILGHRSVEPTPSRDSVDPIGDQGSVRMETLITNSWDYRRKIRFNCMQVPRIAGEAATPLHPLRPGTRGGC